MNTKRIFSRRRALPVARLAASVFAVALATGAVAEVRVDGPWARATVAGQQASGAFMTLTSSSDARLVGVQSPAAGNAEIHEMTLENNVMRMHAIDSLPLPAGKPVELRPGGYHLMLLELKKPLDAGQSVALTLTIEDAQGKRERVDVQAQIRPLGGGHGRMH
ncbi:MAG: copper chaperone PCu(A)C [Burkholderiaceae bacterium]|nr:copper chaperone PCu(A)C [Burkholderiaceae bacterium]